MSNNTEQSRFTGITCPECHGPIIEEHASPLKFRCVVGHSYSPEAMQSEHGRKVENALWSAVVNFEEHAMLLRELARDAQVRGEEQERAEFEQKSEKQRAYASELRLFLEKVNPPAFD